MTESGTVDSACLVPVPIRQFYWGSYTIIIFRRRKLRSPKPRPRALDPAHPIRTMTAFFPKACQPKRPSKTPRRRATVDSPSLAKTPRRRATFDAPSLSRPTTRPTLAQRKSAKVHFAELAELCFFESSPAPTSWYTEEDRAKFKRERTADVASLRHRRVGCPVGLERLLDVREALRALLDRRTLVQTVLREQDRQRASGVRDPDEIALASCRWSAQDFRGAQERGKFQEIATFLE